MRSQFVRFIIRASQWLGQDDIGLEGLGIWLRGNQDGTAINSVGWRGMVVAAMGSRGCFGQ